MKRDVFFDVLKGFAIFLVALGHSIQNLHPQWQSYIVNEIIIMFHMPLFMAVSGYFFYPSVTKTDTLHFIKNKFLRLYLPSLSWGLFSVVLLGGNKLLKGNDVSWFWLSGIFFTGLWFLTVLFLLSVIGCLIHNNVKRHKWLAWCVVYVVIYILPDYWMVNELKYLTPFFVGAIYLKKYSWGNLHWSVYVLGILLFIVLLRIYSFDFSLYAMDYAPFTLDWHYKNIIRFLSGVSGIICSLFICRILTKYEKITPPMLYIGGITLPIYALHQKFLIPQKFINYYSESLLVSLFIAVVIIVLSIIFYKVLSKNSILRLFLFGEIK